jgi:hypothetical protein
MDGRARRRRREFGQRKGRRESSRSEDKGVLSPPLGVSLVAVVAIASILLVSVVAASDPAWAQGQRPLPPSSSPSTSSSEKPATTHLLSSAPPSAPPPAMVADASPHPPPMGLSAAEVEAAPIIGANPTYDEQVGLTFTQDLPSLTYNVTALAQDDADGYGPAYLLNGLTTAGYWYQVGISYHWPTSEGVGYDPTFGFSYQVYGSNGKPVYPRNGGAGLSNFSAPVNSGDIVLLSLTFSGSVVDMVARDWNTSAMASESYSDLGASTFIGSQSAASTSQGFFSGLMTEWYHVSSYSANEGKVTYTDEAVGLSSAWMWVDEFVTTNPTMPLFSNGTDAPVSFTTGQGIYPFTSNGITMYASAHTLITGLLNVSSSTVGLSAAPAETTAAAATTTPFTLEANYTLMGLRQSSQMTAGKTILIEADPGTSITISLNASGSSATDMWVFAGTWESPVTTVTFTAGSNVTYVYYHLVEETAAFKVADGGSPPASSSPPELTYEEPPAAASSTAGQVAATQPLGATPVEIFALQGSEASLNGTVLGTTGERWEAGSQNWTLSGPDAIPDPIELFHQYEVSIAYSIVGGGTPAGPPRLNSTSLGVTDVIPLSGDSTTAWLDAGSAYSFTSTLNGSRSGERWLGSAGGSASSQEEPVVVSAPEEALNETYTHQYYADLEVNDQQGGSISPGSGWLNAGSTLRAGAVPATGWQFEYWNGTGAATNPASGGDLKVVLSEPVDEEAIFYVQLSISADAGTTISFSSSGSTTNGSVHAGSTDIVVVPPSSEVTLRASPSLFVYSFSSWKGTAGLANATRPSTSLVVTAPAAIMATSSFDYPVLLGLGATAGVLIIIAVGGSLWLRSRRRRRPDGETDAADTSTAPDGPRSPPPSLPPTYSAPMHPRASGPADRGVKTSIGIP